MKRTTVYDCHIIELPRISFRAGNISIVEGLKNLPFKPIRIFYIYDIPAGESRGAHAHRECHQFIIAASGSFEVSMDDGVNKKTVNLNRPFYGLYIPPGIWANELNFSSGSVCLVLASNKYNEADYIRDYDEFRKFKNINTSII
ncbi:MAG: WxcM-like domain-containing protein [Bacteroidales bacterium]|nr:WxcM-like domain-containing protein [Bacteroidales bacterium]